MPTRFAVALAVLAAGPAALVHFGAVGASVELATLFYGLAIVGETSLPFLALGIDPAVEENVSGVLELIDGRKLSAAQAPIRVAVTGRSVGLPLFESLALLGKPVTMQRLRAAQERLQAESRSPTLIPDSESR